MDLNSINVFNKRNVFDLSHSKTLTCKMGFLIPVQVEEVIPGDTFKQQSEVFIRLAPLVSPVMHEINLMTWTFFVPNRLVWTEWEKFITRGVDGLQAPVHPYRVRGTGLTVPGSLSDYLGMPHSEGTGQKESMLAYRAYNLIYNEWFRDQTITPPIAISLNSGNDVTTVRDLQRKAWEKDYFTSALPWPQRGASAFIPMGSTAPVELNPLSNTPITVINASTKGLQAGAPVATNASGELTASQPGQIDPKTSLRVDLSSATAVSINDFRWAQQAQKFAEKMARGGARYTEYVLNIFGIKSSDARLQRPELLTATKQNISISEVAQTSNSVVGNTTTPQGNLAGHGIMYQNRHRFKKSFEEHGFLMTIACVLPRTAYYQGMPRKYSRETVFDYYNPLFANIGEQAIKNKEILMSHANPDGIFGYTPRYQEYRFNENSIHGLFRSTLEHWHMARKFTSDPALNTTFISSQPAVDIFAYQNEDPVYMFVNHNIRAIRPIPKYGTPQ